ncbi:TonB-dependent copper receptor [Luteolibacter pohnpeiensis]|uniref:TonB-dependent copper receptor n=1 Tax=Luteolibacter pohnpeiensis TaxID=454153 RepID=A0A934S6F8_9BACT|nr:TonB-dependent copper receptor [Luteolibacter pohnpeiensis]MBK1882733.1 TonB-dependent copper receptor [Luteolibacter pohnpeiensis]
MKPKSIVRNSHLFISLTLAGFSTASGAVTAVPTDGTLQSLEPIIVTASASTESPLETIIDTSNAAQPIPAQDGADMLKLVPGFSVSRKGGSGGEPILRGQSGSRIGILLNGETLFGGCPYRMDPPTAYIFPNAFDQVRILKGPQTVIYGPGNSAGVVLFETSSYQLESTGTSVDASATYGSYQRNDQDIEITTGTPDVYLKLGYNHTQSDDYEDGDGNKVHSNYDRWNTHAAIGWTPDSDTVLELSGGLSEGEAAYAGKSMDATQLDYQNLGLFFQKKNVSDLVSKIEARFAYNYADHVMDDFRLRTPGMMSMGEAEVDHQVWSGKFLTELKPADGTLVTAGVDFRDSRHRNYDSGSWVTDGEINDIGIFTELSQDLTPNSRLIAGARADRWNAEDKRETIWSGSMMMGSYVDNPTAGEDRMEVMPSGFIRYEQDLTAIPAKAYIGVGYTERAPDYWELFPNPSTNSISSFDTDPEKTVQLDAGLNYQDGPLTAWTSGFINRVDDYILYQSNYPIDSMSTGTVTRNVDAWSWGGEAGVSYEFLKYWKADTSISYVWGKNRTDDRALAQQPPLEGKIGLTYARDNWSVGGLMRLVSAQNRYAEDQGTIVGQDLGATGGFGVFSLNADWRVTKNTTLAAGVDNLFDKTYAEHVNTAGTDVVGYTTTTRVNEPGRVFWMKLSLKF